MSSSSSLKDAKNCASVVRLTFRVVMLIGWSSDSCGLEGGARSSVQQLDRYAVIGVRALRRAIAWSLGHSVSP